MKILSHTVDPRADAAYCYLTKEPIAATEEVAEGIVVDLDANGRPVGVEILHVAARLRGGRDLESYLQGLVEGLFAERLQAAE